MPKIQWTDLPEAIRKHLLLRLKERKITEEELYELKLWRESEPVSPCSPYARSFSIRSGSTLASRKVGLPMWTQRASALRC